MPTGFGDEVVRLSWAVALSAAVVQAILHLLEEMTRLDAFVVNAVLLWRAAGVATGARRETIRRGLALLVAGVAVEFASGGLIQFVD